MSISDTAHKKINQLIAAIRAEHDVEKNDAAIQLKNVPIKILKSEGKCVYPVMIKRVEFNKAEYVVIEFEWTNVEGLTHQFQPGKKARVFTTTDHELFFDGTVVKAGKDYLKITTHLNEDPEWLHDGKIGIGILHDAFTFREAEHALTQVLETKDKKSQMLIEICYGETEVELEEFDPVPLKGLNKNQEKAISGIINCTNVFLVHGPPGTGKSTTIAHAIEKVLETEDQVLFCAPSNTAVDVMTDKLMENGIKVLRIGNPVKISKNTLHASLDYQVSQHEHQKIIRDLRKKADELHRMAGKYKRVFGHEEREHRRLLYSEAKKMSADASEMEEQLDSYLIKNAQVICCTPALSNSGYLKDLKFKTLFFDEATQATDPLVWIPALKTERIILAGDHQQLGPTVKSDEGRKLGLEKSLFEQLIEKKVPSVMLTEQYRMNEKIMRFSSNKFYSNKLSAHLSVSDHLLDNDTLPFLFIDTAGAGYNEAQSDKSQSLINLEESAFIEKWFSTFKMDHGDFSTGIITPYSAQANLLREKIKLDKNILISTVDGFQGQERDMIIISCVRSNDKNEIGFLKDYRRMNVAMTRARKKLVIIGDSATLGNDQFYKELIDYAEHIGGYTTVWEFMS